MMRLHAGTPATSIRGRRRRRKPMLYYDGSSFGNYVESSLATNTWLYLPDLRERGLRPMDPRRAPDRPLAEVFNTDSVHLNIVFDRLQGYLLAYPAQGTEEKVFGNAFMRHIGCQGIHLWQMLLYRILLIFRYWTKRAWFSTSPSDLLCISRVYHHDLPVLGDGIGFSHKLPPGLG